ncbi:protein of unknown function (plasmid) [Paraburkholderia kururiensis]|uniref:beta strand repeat-containing protein n=1 Tax=Paraburkholderia kururiensis TaxID=984307 RepID=UPI0039A5F27A
MSEITAGVFFSNLFGAAASAANAGTNTQDVVGTAVGIGQAVQGGVSLIAGNIDSLAKPLGGAGLLLGVAGLVANYQNIHDDLAAKRNPAASDLVGAIGNVASFVGSALVLASVGETLVIPIAAVGAAAGAVQLVASATGYRVDVNGIASQVQLTASEWAQAASQLETLNSNPSVLSSALSSAGINPGATNTFLVPLTDMNGNVVGFQPETPTGSLQLGDGITQYTFSGGTTFQQQASSYVDPTTGLTNYVINPLAAWTIPQANGSVATLNLSSNGGYQSSITNSAGAITQQLHVGVTAAESNGITTTTRTYSSNLGGQQNTLQEQISVNGNTAADTSTVFNSDGSISYTEKKSSTSGIVTSDIIDANINASLAVAGDNVVLNGAAGDIVSAYGRNDVLNGNNAQFSIASSATVSVNGNGNTITGGTSTQIAVAGNANTIRASNDSVTIGSNDTGNNIFGSGTTVNAGSGDTFGVYGSSNLVTESDGSGVWLNGNSNTVRTSGAGASVTIGSNDTGNNIFGSGTTVNAGSGDTFGVYGSSNLVTESDGSGVWLNGNSNTVRTSGAGASVTIGSNDTGNNIFGSGTTVNAGSGDTFGVYGSSNLVTESDGSGVWLNGNSNTVRTSGTGASVTIGSNDTGNNIFGSGTTVNAGSGDTFGVYGSSNLVTESDGSGVWLNGNSNTVRTSGAGASVTIGSNDTGNNIFGSGTTVNAGSGDTFGVYGASDIVNAGGNTSVWIGGNGQSASVAQDNHVNFTGLGGTVTEQDNSRVDVAGNEVTLNVGSNDLAGLSGSGNTANITGNGTSLWIGGNGSNASAAQDDHVNVSGAAGIVNEIDNSRVDIRGSGLTINAGYQDLLGIAGSANSIAAGAGDTVALDGQQNKVTLSYGKVYANNNNQFTLSGSFNSVTTGNGAVSALWGDDNIISSGSNARVDVSGVGNDIYSGAGSIIGVIGGDNAVESSNVTVYVADNSNVEIWGSNDIIYGGVNSRIILAGGSNTVYGAQGAAVGISGGADNNSVSVGSQGFVNIGSSHNSVTTGVGSTVITTLGSATGNVVNAGSGSTVRNSISAPPYPSQTLPNTSQPAATQIITNPYANIPYVYVNTNVPPSAFWQSVVNTTTAQGPAYYPFIPSADDPTVGVPIPATSSSSDPIILNLSGGPVQTTSLSGSTTTFDMQNNGQQVQTAWGTAGEGYLVYDPNDAGNSATVTQDSQLVGGFDQLQALAQQADGSSTGSLNATDALWNSLKVWVDTTGTGQFQSGELYSLSQLGITSIDLDGTQVNQNSNGNQILVDSTFTYTNGRTGDIAAVNLMYNAGAAQPASTATAGLAEIQLNRLIASMASYGVDGTGEAVTGLAQATPESMLAVAAH